MLAADGAVEPVTVKSVAYFGFDRATVRPADRAVILAEVAKMKDVTWQTVTATGHTDSIGAPAYNTTLSDRRARAVKAYLVEKGLDPAMVQTEAQAAGAPLAPNDTRQGRSKNRRADIEFRGVRTVAAR
jgi:OOP family OmpA-OmpF porin